MGYTKGMVLFKSLLFQEVNIRFQKVGQGGDQSGYVDTRENKKMLHRFSLYIETYYLLYCGVGLIREGNDGNCGNIGTEKIRGIK